MIRLWASGCVLGLAVGFIGAIVYMFGAPGIRWDQVAVTLLIAALVSFAVAKVRMPVVSPD